MELRSFLYTQYIFLYFRANLTSHASKCASLTSTKPQLSRQLTLHYPPHWYGRHTRRRKQVWGLFSRMSNHNSNSVKVCCSIALKDLHSGPLDKGLKKNIIFLSLYRGLCLFVFSIGYIPIVLFCISRSPKENKKLTNRRHYQLALCYMYKNIVFFVWFSSL